MDLKERIVPEKVPAHVAIIMDGNGRWARQQGKHRMFGHSKGVESVRSSLIAATEVGVEYLTLYAFSTENWHRPQKEVNALMNLLVDTLMKEVNELDQQGVRITTIGDTTSLPEECVTALKEAKKRTAKNDRITLVLALSYSAKWDLVNAVQKIAGKVKEGTLDIDSINEEQISEHLTTASIPDPELLIRTSGEQRISNFFLWQAAYTELSFPETLWPDFGKEDLYQAIIEYQNRERRFGRISEQITDDDPV